MYWYNNKNSKLYEKLDKFNYNDIFIDKYIGGGISNFNLKINFFNI